MFELFLGMKYLKAKRKQRFISVITVISILGVMVGVMALVVVLSVMNGFRADLMSKILGVNSHILVLSLTGPFSDYHKAAEKVDKVEGVIASTPFIYTQVMINNSGQVSGAILRGVDPESAGAVVTFKSMIKDGSITSLGKKIDGIPPIIIGGELAKQIGAHPGNVITVISPEGKLTPLGRTPNTRKFKVAALFDSGMYEYDASMVYISLKEAQDFLALGDKVTGLEVRVKDVYKSDTISRKVQKALGYPYWTKDWKVMNRSLFSALKLEKLTMFVILTMIVLVGALNIISTLVMVVMEKTRDVAILRAMGASARSIMTIFMFQGLLVGVVGTIAGLVSGLGLCQLLAKYKFINLPADVYYISTLPVKIEVADVSFVAGAAVVISFLATLYPSWYASRLNPVESFRYE
ncbi:MAG: lipoprotein-releasing ABC transporter permease subunit [Desulfobacteraceae bacterium]|uniref:Lipoprotein-releasing ABC transporter permease subunit n=1 Tax=Candidatus Desulfacyla euxinica TaxID=2841693 RepID=A0A8J6T4T1_9DELT|nr:lipoprotein-releasing ABC transporter permease subunit [Candidatus Desulfacyla euxinica]MBL6978611.1 lipoprotein-releasing ABC transporter permease subunit [Desulfobacteraceae bacterium]